MRLDRLVMALSCTGLAACNTDSLTSVSETTAALETAQTEFCTFRAQADGCRAAFDGCVVLAGADVKACRATLRDCLPTPPAHAEGGGGCEGMHEGGGPPPTPPPLPDGGFPLPGRGGSGGRGGHGPGGHGGPGPRPEPAAVQACRDALIGCLAATPGDATCLETERTCVRDAFRAAFDAACADATTTCAALPADACAHLQARCAEGIDGRVDSDGGVCAAPPAIVP